MARYGYKVVYADHLMLAKAGFSAVAKLPFIFDPAPGFARIPNQFLMDRGIGLWEPKLRGKAPSPLPPSRVSMRNFAQWLANALEWAELRGVDLVIADYSTDVIGRYQKDMLNGTWSASGRPLSAKTVNCRVQVVVEFQMWAADKGLRPPFEMPPTTSISVVIPGLHSTSHQSREIHIRKGKVKVKPKDIILPSRSAVERWRQQVMADPIFGVTEGLIVDLILNTAIRREEAACWRVDTLPLDRGEWHITNPDSPIEFQHVSVSISHGVKGSEYGVDRFGDKIGPEGNIQIPIAIAERIVDYCNGERARALKIILRTGKTAHAQRAIRANAVHLFLNPTTGKRYSGEQIYAAWNRHRIPFGWTPHMGRHWWACCQLENRMKNYLGLMKQVEKLDGVDIDSPLAFALRQTVQTVLQLEIQPQLRHANSATTELYLRWFFNKFRVPVSLAEPLFPPSSEG